MIFTEFYIGVDLESAISSHMDIIYIILLNYFPLDFGNTRCMPTKFITGYHVFIGKTTSNIVILSSHLAT